MDQEPSLKGKQKAFADRYLSNGMNQTEAYMFAYNYPPEKYDQASVRASELVRNSKVSAYISHHTQQQAMSRDEWLQRTAAVARVDLSQYIKREGKRYYVDIDLLKADGYGFILDGIDYSQTGETKAVFLSRQKAMDNLGKALGITNNKNIEHSGNPQKPMRITVEYVERDIDAS